ncbi:hypothetical protein NM688_g4043 [Phlebia brevispora]|uniref:Uncharacterized protein n=1 Tax=Phlebia brevispora TaxID=194682 RepID=A0ACC1T484_9APHY|nr:hypothetical protein NM688_g4043 [Phlebia brevispora]
MCAQLVTCVISAVFDVIPELSWIGPVRDANEITSVDADRSIGITLMGTEEKASTSEGRWALVMVAHSINSIGVCSPWNRSGAFKSVESQKSEPPEHIMMNPQGQFSLQSLSDLYTARYTHAVPLAMLLYHYVLTLSDEIDLFWRRRWSIAQLLFFLIRSTRYLTATSTEAIFDKHVSPHIFRTAADMFALCAPILYSCKIWGRGILVASAVSVIYTVHAILILRLYGLYASKRLLYCLLTLFGFAFAAELYIAVRFTPTFLAVSLGPPIGSVCVTQDMTKLTFIWIPILIFEIVVFLLALYKGLQQVQQRAIYASQLMQIMLRDSFAYFLIIVAIDIVNLIVWIHVRATLRSVTWTFTTTLMSILGSQMMMNIRLEARLKTFDLDTLETFAVNTNSGSGLTFPQLSAYSPDLGSMEQVLTATH